MTRGSLGFFSINHMSTVGMVIFFFLKIPHPPQGVNHWPWGNVDHHQAQGLCSGDHDQHHKACRGGFYWSPKALVPGPVMGEGRRGLGWKQPSTLKRTNCADSKKKNFFFQKCLWVNLSCPQLPRGIENLLPSHFCGFQSNPNFSVH